MATHSSILAWWSPWTEEPGGLQLFIPYGGCKESDTFTFSLSYLVLLVIAASEKTFLKQCVSSSELALAFTLFPESTFYLENANGTDQQIPVTRGR